MQTIESYPNIRRAYLTMSRANGGINQSRSEEDALRASDEVIGQTGTDHADLVAADEWIGTLTDDEMLTLVDGDHTDCAALVSRAPSPEKTEGLLSDLFDVC